MAKYRITSPSGETFEITAPDGATMEQVQAFAQQQFASMQQPGATQQPDAPRGNARAGGVAGGVLMGLRDPVDAGAQILRRVVPEPVARVVDAAGNWLADQGLPVARSQGAAGVDALVRGANERYEADRTAAGRDGFDAARLVGNVVNPVNAAVPSAVGARTVGQLAMRGAQAGAIGGALQPVLNTEDGFWAQKAQQAAAGAAAGAVLTPVVAKGAERAATAIKAAQQARPAPGPIVISSSSGIDPRQLDQAVQRIIDAQGMTLDEVPKVVLDSVRRQTMEALATGKRLDGAAAMRAAQAEALGMTGDAALTAGQLTRDPIRYAQERNLSGIVINTPRGPGNPLADRFQAQNQQLKSLFDLAGARDAVDSNTAGQHILASLRAADAPVKAGVDDAYTAARAMNNGRAAELNRPFFSQTANRRLDEGMFGRFLPPEVRNLLNDISDGTTPFNVDASVQIDGILSKAQRKASRAGDDAGATAIGVIRDALHETPLMGPQAMPSASRALGPVIPGATAEDTGAAARAAFDQARAAARQRFATIEQTPALKAALDEEAPDAFVRKYIIGANARDLNAMRKVLQGSPEALQQARAQVAQHLKQAAFGTDAAGDKVFAPERYAKTLQAIGPERLRVFFSPQELVRFNLAAKVAAEINSVPAGAKNAVNYSNTGAALFNLLQKVSEAPGLRQIPGIRALANQAGEIAQERAVQSAMQPATAAAQPAAELSPEALRALQALFAPAGLAFGATAGSGQ